ncbi:MAG TPA: translation initiation factor IF-2 N-terminal domain-containing protein [Phycisphaerales bacterium]|nr:translation initiation factor IF-2 N-terminal domain-containing protein [Phycisphaerales bacterium]
MAPKKNENKTDAPELMVVNDSPGEECRIAIVQENHLEELFTERTATATNVGNIYKGRVTNVEAAIQAAFVDYGAGQNGFLHISDLHPRYFPGVERTERVGKKIPRKERPLIQEALRRGDEILVQVLKQGIGTKGPTLTSYLSIPGRLLVMMPDMDRVGVSRKVEDEEKRREMRKILDSLDLPEGFGFILRTAGFEQPKTELKRDAAYLQRLWKAMEKRIKSHKAPCELYTETDLLIRTIRDVLRPSIQAIIVDSESAYERASTFLSVVAPRSAPKVIHYRKRTPIFHAFDIERQIELIHSREVPLPSGGKLVIDQTEALVAIDVNSGKSRAARDSETNAYNTNCEAVDEICRQLRLRDLGGLIINDLIDMRSAKHRRLIEERFENNLKRDRAKATILKISDFGLVEMTRQRMRPSLRKSHFVPCSHCNGHGEIKSAETVAADATRQIGYLLQFDRVRRVEIACSPRVASVLLSAKRRELVRMEDATGRKIDVRVSDAIAHDRVDFYAYDDRNADIDIAQLPAPRIPTIQELEAAAAEVEPAIKAADTKAAPKKSAAGPASATSIMLADDEDDDSPAESAEESEGGKRKRRRRRRRRRGDDTAEQAPLLVTTEVEAAPNAEPEPVFTETMRIHALAKELGCTSRDILSRCAEEAKDIDLKNHMSSVSPDDANRIAKLFAPPAPVSPSKQEQPAPSPTPQAAGAMPVNGQAEQDPGRKRRRRRRGGRGRGGNAETRTPDDRMTTTIAPAQAPPPAPTPAPAVAAESTPGEKSKRRRRRRGKRGGETPTANPANVASAPPQPTPTVRTPEPPSPKPTLVVVGEGNSNKTRGRKTRKKVKGIAASEPAPAPVTVAVPATTETKPDKKRRPLYRNRGKVSPAVRERAEQSADD